MSRMIALEALAVFKALVRPLLGPACCRFHPTCSEFAREAIESRGVLGAAPLIVGRLLRCHPFHPGGADPVESHG
ncbi:MAG: membrane protein insertion efficiency factor YidD [Elusimicrobia bacterium]|nr:membrane protein insertion efficiency factor YidD [Elusimicrobiota bacterium]